MDIEELYGLPLDRFVAERNALARELRISGRRDEAGAVAQLRKPSVAARAVNQLAREHRRQLRDLFSAGDALSEVQSSVLAGRADGSALSEAAGRERAAVSTLVATARTLLAAEGLAASASVLERVGETLHAAALDENAREPVDEGRLERELRHVGLGMDAGASSEPAKARSSARRSGSARDETPPGKRTEAELRREAQERAEAHEQAATAEAEARRRATRAAKAVGTAERKRARAAHALEQAEEALTVARAEATAAESTHRKAERELRKRT